VNPRWSRWRTPAAGALSGLLFALAFPPVGAVILLPLALVPWLVALAGEESRGRALLSGLVFGLVNWCAAIPWIVYVVTHYGGQSAIMGVVWVLGLMGLIGAPMDPWNIMTPILLLAIGAGHSVQILKRYYEEYARARTTRPDVPSVEHNRIAVIEATVKVGVVMLAAGTIASLSFASLAAFGLPTIKNFGLCTAFGIVAALTVEMTFIPAIRVLMKPPSQEQTDREKREEYFDPILEKLARTVRAGRERPIVWVFAVIILVALGGLLRLKVGNTLGAQFFERNAPVHGFRMADARLAGTRVIQVLIEGDKPDTIKQPDVLNRMDQLGSFIAHQPLPVGKVVSLVDLLKQMSIVMDRAGGGKLPDTTQGVAQYLLLYAMGGEEEDLAHFVDHDFQRSQQPHVDR